MKAVVIVVLTVGSLLVLGKLLVLWLEPRAAFYPWTGERETPALYGLAFDRVPIRTADGETLAAWWLPGPPGSPEVLFFHGNGGNLSLWADVIAGIRRQGWSVFAVDYRGYGLSTGRPTEEGLYLDAAACVDAFWTARHVPGNHTVYWGRSLGATIAAHAASRRAPDRLILESPLYSARSLMAGNPLTAALAIFATYRFETVEQLRGYRGPTLVVHGQSDTIIPLAQGQRVFDRLSGPKTWLLIPGADHNDLHLANPSLYWAGIRRFIETAQ
jgi:pimeloyl-ACP methyl ester carboxylesterase